MQLSNNTVAILNSMMTINETLWINKGNVLNSIAPSDAYMASATVEESFPVDCGFSNLPELLSCIGLFKSPELDFQEDSVFIKEGRSAIQYLYSDPDIVRKVKPKIGIKVSDNWVTFDFPEQKFRILQKALNVLRSSCFAFVGTGSSIYVETVPSSEGTMNNSNYRPVYRDELENFVTEPFRMVFDIQMLRIIPIDFTVTLDLEQKFAKFYSENLSYWVVAQYD